ncbi:selenoprotein Pb-like [Pelodytes ibericus]
MGPRVHVLFALFALLVSPAHSSQNETSICKLSPAWSIGDEAPMNGTLGQVTVVALLQASCGFCLVQAANMGPLRDQLLARGLSNISYMIVNDQSYHSKLMLPVLLRKAPLGIPVFEQDPSQADVWDLLNGDKDDFLIYDRCGRLTFHIRLPYSYLHFPYVESAIRYTYYQDYCGNCSFYSNITRLSKNESIANRTEPTTPSASAERKLNLQQPPNLQQTNDHKHGGHLTGQGRATNHADRSQVDKNGGDQEKRPHSTHRVKPGANRK